jgi:hypothetical protein
MEAALSDDAAALEALEDVFGVAFAPERAVANLAAFRTILPEIEKLRELDLADVHPAVVFDPAPRHDGASDGD